MLCNALAISEIRADGCAKLAGGCYSEWDEPMPIDDGADGRKDSIGRDRPIDRFAARQRQRPPMRTAK